MLRQVALYAACAWAAAKALERRVGSGPAAGPTLLDVFVGGTDGYACYRIPALLSLGGGRLLLFAEGRRDSCADHGSVDIVARASSDGGASWGALSLVRSQGAGVTVGNPAPMLLSNGSVLLAYSVNNTFAALLLSSDGGATWSPAGALPVPPSWTWVATGPPAGLVLASGRLVIPADHNDGKSMSAHCYLSDDGGASWRISTSIADGDESQAVALPWLGAGAVLMSSRSHGARRLAARSDDGGETFGTPWLTVAENECEASTIALPAHPAGPRLVMSTALSTLRVNMSLLVSDDAGHSWTPAQQIYEGSSAYSAVVGVADDAVALAFERDLYARISFVARVAV